jgi:hypothetical protein
VGIPIDADPNARAKCPRCRALVLVADWREHEVWDVTILGRLKRVEAALEEPAPEPELVDWPGDGDQPAATPSGPYAPEPAAGPGL